MFNLTYFYVSLPLETAQLDQDSLETSQSSHIQAIGGWSVMDESVSMPDEQHLAWLLIQCISLLPSDISLQEFLWLH